MTRAIAGVLWLVVVAGALSLSTAAPVTAEVERAWVRVDGMT